MTSSDWHKNPRTIITIIAFIFGLGVAWTSLSFRVVAVEDNQDASWRSINNHRTKDGHAGTANRMIELETHMGYLREDVDEIKDIVKENGQAIQSYISRRERDSN